MRRCFNVIDHLYLKLMTTILLAVCLFFSQIILSPQDVSAAQPSVILSGVKGDVFVKKGGGLLELPGVNGMELVQGDWLRTGKNGTAKLSYDDGTEATIGSSSSLNIQRLSRTESFGVSSLSEARVTYSQNGQQSSLQLWSGSVWSKVKSLLNMDDSYEVETPTAVMGVRGTLYLVSVNPENGATQGDVIEGVVGVTQNNEATQSAPIQLVTMGQTLRLVSLDEPMPEHQVIDPKELIQTTQAEILVQLVNDIMERTKELTVLTKEQQKAYGQTGVVDNLKMAIGTSFKVDELASFAKEFVTSLQTSDKLEDVKQVLSDNHQSLEQLQSTIETIKNETEEIRSEVIEAAEEAGVSEEEIESIGKEAAGIPPTPDSVPPAPTPAPTPPTVPNPTPNTGSKNDGGSSNSGIATVTSSQYLVGAGTISNVPYGTDRASFLSKVQKGESHQTWDTTGVHDPVQNNDQIVVTAQNGTQMTYIILVNGAEAYFKPTGRPDELYADSKLYREFRLMDGDVVVDLSAEEGKTLTVTFEEGQPQLLPLNSNSTLWFETSRAPGLYTFNLTTTDSSYKADLNWETDIPDVVVEPLQNITPFSADLKLTCNEFARVEAVALFYDNPITPPIQDILNAGNWTSVDHPYSYWGIGRWLQPGELTTLQYEHLRPETDYVVHVAVMDKAGNIQYKTLEFTTLPISEGSLRAVINNPGTNEVNTIQVNFYGTDLSSETLSLQQVDQVLEESNIFLNRQTASDNPIRLGISEIAWGQGDKENAANVDFGHSLTLTLLQPYTFKAGDLINIYFVPDAVKNSQGESIWATDTEVVVPSPPSYTVNRATVEIQGIASAVVKLYKWSDNSLCRQPLTLDANGLAHFTNVMDGEYYLVQIVNGLEGIRSERFFAGPSSRVISGVVSLPDGVTETDLSVHINASSGYGNGWANVVIPKGSNSQSYSLTLPANESSSGYRVSYYLESQSDYLTNAWYVDDETMTPYNSQAGFVDVSNEDKSDVNLSLMNGIHITGIVALPSGTAQSDMYVTLNAETINGDDYYAWSKAIIKKGTSVSAYSLTVPNNNSGISKGYYLSYYINPLTSYISHAWYSGINLMSPYKNNAAYVKVYDDDIENIDLTLLDGQKISGEVTLPVGLTAPSDCWVYVNAQTDNGTSENPLDDFGTGTSIIIPKGQSSNQYVLTVPKNDGASGYRVSYGYNYMGESGENHYEHGWYSADLDNSTTWDTSHASSVNVSNGDQTNINLTVLGYRTISGMIELPVGATETENISITVHAELEPVTVATDPWFVSNGFVGFDKVTLQAGSTSVPYCLVVPANAESSEGYRISYDLMDTKVGYSPIGWYAGPDNMTVYDFDLAKKVSVSGDSKSDVNLTLLQIHTVPIFDMNYPHIDAATLTANSMDLKVKINKNGTVHYVMVESADAASLGTVTAEIVKSWMSEDYSEINSWSGRIDVNASDVVTRTINDYIKGSTTYKLYVVAEDLSGNLTGVSELEVTTPGTDMESGADISHSFTDPSFKQAVWEWLGKSGEPGAFTKDDLTARMVSKDNGLIIFSRNISSLAGLENFEGTGLMYLDCSSNQLSSLPDLPTSLIELDCSANALTTLPPLPTDLIWLDCSGNRLTTLPSLPTGLTYLSVSNNYLDVFEGTLKSTLDGCSAETKDFTPQYRYNYAGNPITLGLGFTDTSTIQIKLSLQESFDGTYWNDCDYADGVLSDFTFTSSDEEVATVDSYGIISAVSPGSCNIYARYGNLDSDFTTVIIPVINVVIPMDEWIFSGLWNINDSNSNIQNNSVGKYVELATGDDSGGLLPSAPSGKSYWFGSSASDNTYSIGNYMGQQMSEDWDFSGGTSSSEQKGELISPILSVPETEVNSHPVLTFSSWWEIESESPEDFDLMQIYILVEENEQISKNFLARLNPNQVEEADFQPQKPYTSGGYNLPAVWESYTYDLSEYAGKEIRIVFNFDTLDGNYNAFRGWLIDSDIKISSVPTASQAIEGMLLGETPNYFDVGTEAVEKSRSRGNSHVEQVNSLVDN